MANTKSYHFRLPAEVIGKLDDLVAEALASAPAEVASGINRTTLVRVAIREMHERSDSRKNPKKKKDSG